MSFCCKTPLPLTIDLGESNVSWPRLFDDSPRSPWSVARYEQVCEQATAATSTNSMETPPSDLPSDLVASSLLAWFFTVSSFARAHHDYFAHAISQAIGLAVTPGLRKTLSLVEGGAGGERGIKAHKLSTQLAPVETPHPPILRGPCNLCVSPPS